MLDNGPIARKLLSHPNATSTSCKPKAFGNLFGTDIKMSANVGPYELSYDAKGGTYFDGSNGYYSEDPRFEMQLNPLSYGAGIGASASLEVFGW